MTDEISSDRSILNKFSLKIKVFFSISEAVLVKENEEIKLQSYSLSHALFPQQKHFITLKEIFIQFHMIVVLEMILWSYKEGYY